MFDRETTLIGRTYYYRLNDKTVVPDEESMVAFLLDRGVIFLSSNEDKTVSLCININDYFAPGADAEDLSLENVPKLFEMFRLKGINGVSQFVAEQRGIPNKKWNKNN